MGKAIEGGVWIILIDADEEANAKARLPEGYLSALSSCCQRTESGPIAGGFGFGHRTERYH